MSLVQTLIYSNETLPMGIEEQDNQHQLAKTYQDLNGWETHQLVNNTNVTSCI